MSAHTFAQIPKAEIQRSSFDRSHGHKTTIEGGYLYPIFVDEALPGDTFNLKMHAIARLATPIFPIMDNIYIDTFFFAVPYRLVWDQWEKMNGAQDNPTDSTDYVIPQIEGATVSGQLADYMGLPIGVADLSVSALPFRAYALIWNTWFRDQNLQNSIAINTDYTFDDYTDYTLQRRGKRHDYFTSCLPWPQKGDAVTIPLGTTAPVITQTTEHDTNGAPALRMRSVTAGALVDGFLGIEAANQPSVSYLDEGFVSAQGAVYPTNLYADLSTATAATINTLRQAFQVQKILERDARGGTRYTELIKSHFGVTSPDARLQRPEYLGGFSQPINIAQIHQTQATESGNTPLGQVGAIGTAVLNGNRNGFTSSFTEHCVIIGLVNVRSDMTYQNRVDRMWSRSTRYDFYWPALAHIGEQAVLNKELYYAGTSVDDDVFGYQERYGEYRYKPSQVTGLMRSDAAGSLDAWHLGYDFADTPALNSTFIVDDPPLDRVVAVPSEPKFILDTWFDFRCARPMPMFGVPGLIDHF